MRIELFYVRECPHRATAVQLVREVLLEQGMPTKIEEIEVGDAAQANALEFVGSPTIRVDGQDVERDVAGSGAYGLSCRRYLAPGHSAGVPPREWVVQAVRSACARNRAGKKV